jgi:foldase protein PrsA
VTRRPAPLAALLLAGLLLAGCGNGTGSGIGVAARVGDNGITTTALRDRVERGYADRVFAQQHSREDYQRGWLQRLVRAELVRVAARRLGVTVSKADVDKRFDQFVETEGSRELFEKNAADQGTAKGDLRQAVADLVLYDAVADKLVADVTVTDAELRAAYQKALPRFDVAHIAHVAVDDKKTADLVAAQARGGADFAALAKKYSKDVNTKDEGGDLGEIGNGDGKFEKSFERAVFSAQTGAIVGPIKAQSGYEVVRIVKRRTTTFEQARDEVRRAVIGQQRDAKVAAYLNDLATELHVVVNPRFGRWDAQRGVVASGDDLSSPAPSPGDAAAPATP